MTNNIEFRVGVNTNGQGGIHLHIRQDDHDFIKALHALALANGRDYLAKQITRYGGDELFPPPPAPEEPEVAPAEPTHKRHAASADDDPVHDMNVGEAIDSISRMRSQDKLRQVIDNDQRASVKTAATKRLAELG